MKHRKEIDGLRSLAVVPVILNHAKFPMFSGGFVGVDIFFVISGFLISDIITREIRDQNFSILTFYERRTRRIIPALALVITVSFAAAILCMMPEDLDNFSQSVVATLAFSNNILLALTSGYWEMSSNFKPLLHTWSLGVEEQFYFLYPLIVMMIFSRRRGAFPYLLAAGLALSLAASIILTPRYPDAAFYLIPTRAWELLLGALAAHLGAGNLLRGRANDALSLLGLAFVTIAVVMFDETIAYPGVHALLPCIGTVLILMCATRGTIANRLLSLPPLVGIGLISYSAYLWHQPLFAFARILSVRPPGMALMAALSIATLVLAFLSWRYVERPFRDRARVSSRSVGVFAAGSSVLLGVAALVAYVSAGLPQRVPGIGLGRGKHIAYNERVFRYKRNHFVTNRPRLLIVGSSTARDLMNVILESGRFARFEIIYRDDVTICNADPAAQAHGDLVIDADALVWAASYLADPACRYIRASTPPLAGKPLIVVGPKHFGYNLNVYIRTPVDERADVRAALLPDTNAANEAYRQLAPARDYQDLLATMQRRFGGVPVFDVQGRILSADRVHLTEAGARFFATFVFDDPVWQDVLLLEKRVRQPLALKAR